MTTTEKTPQLQQLDLMPIKKREKWYGPIGPTRVRSCWQGIQQ